MNVRKGRKRSRSEGVEKRPRTEDMKVREEEGRDEGKEGRGFKASVTRSMTLLRVNVRKPKTRAKLGPNANELKGCCKERTQTSQKGAKETDQESAGR